MTINVLNINTYSHNNNILIFHFVIDSVALYLDRIEDETINTLSLW